MCSAIRYIILFATWPSWAIAYGRAVLRVFLFTDENFTSLWNSVNEISRMHLNGFDFCRIIATGDIFSFLGVSFLMSPHFTIFYIYASPYPLSLGGVGARPSSCWLADEFLSQVWAQYSHVTSLCHNPTGIHIVHTLAGRVLHHDALHTVIVGT